MEVRGEDVNNAPQGGTLHRSLSLPYLKQLLEAAELRAGRGIVVRV